ncbi:MAG: hypothetical protein ACK40Z_13440 [Dietzia sp.]
MARVVIVAADTTAHTTVDTAVAVLAMADGGLRVVAVGGVRALMVRVHPASCRESRPSDDAVDEVDDHPQARDGIDHVLDEGRKRVMIADAVD